MVSGEYSDKTYKKGDNHRKPEYRQDNFQGTKARLMRSVRMTRNENEMSSRRGDCSSPLALTSPLRINPCYNAKCISSEPTRHRLLPCLHLMPGLCLFSFTYVIFHLRFAYLHWVRTGPNRRPELPLMAARGRSIPIHFSLCSKARPTRVLF